MNAFARLLPGDRIIRLQCLIIVVVALLFSALLGTRFFSVANFQSITAQLPILGMLALGMGVTMLTGGINLSIIAGANACSLVMAAIIVAHPDQPLFLLLALLAGLAVAVAIGALNGALIAWIGVSPILATLGTMTLITGLNILLSNGAVIAGFPPLFQQLGSATLLGIPLALLLFFGGGRRPVATVGAHHPGTQPVSDRIQPTGDPLQRREYDPGTDRRLCDLGRARLGSRLTDDGKI
ncbi:Autoinducer 2 import system permease protein lsrC [Edwardsiella tarda]|nr:Autoinducer 2 import system permease protein lsrC [Edwardsiella tarda]